MAWTDVGEFELMFRAAGWARYLAEHPLGAVGEARSKTNYWSCEATISVSLKRLLRYGVVDSPLGHG
jgi:hypothetical protein